MGASVESFLIRKDVTLKAAMRQLEETEERTLFVVDEEGCLFGSITDGDIRRWILAEGSLEESVGEACNRNPFTVRCGFKNEDVRQAMVSRNIFCVPVVDKKGLVTELLFWDQMFQDVAETEPRVRPLDVPVVVMAGGKGTRLDPFTRILPKPLIPVGDKAIIEIIIDSFAAKGVREFFLSVNHKAALIKSFFEDLRPPYGIRYIEEPKPLGTAGGLRGLAGKVDGTLIVTNCDIIVRMDYAELVKCHETEGNDITVVASLKAYKIPYGVCELGSGGRLSHIVEKPKYDLLVNTGMYVLRSEILSLIPENQVFHATDLIDAVLKGGGKVGVYPVAEDAWLDTGEWAEYRRTVQALGN